MSRQPAYLKFRNIELPAGRTAVRIESTIWEMVMEIAGLEKCSVFQLCTHIEMTKPANQSYTSALRVFPAEYYRMMASVSGLKMVGLMIDRSPRKRKTSR